MLQIKDNRNDFGTICICAIRYALGRQTYMPELVQDFIRDNIELISDKDKKVMVRDIKEHGEKGFSYGMDFDEKAWMQFLEFLLEKLN